MNHINRILIAIDDGPFSEVVASGGLNLGQQLNAEISLISVVDTTALMTEGNITPAELAGIIKSDLANNQQELTEKVFKGHKVDAFVEMGKPHEVILDAAEKLGADLIVLGTHGRTGLSHMILGSIAEKVIRHSTKPLFIIPARH